MAGLRKEDAMMLKAQVYDLSENGAKQALMGMVEILEEHPSILTQVFCLLIEDATRLTIVTGKRASSQEVRAFFEGG